MTDDEYRKASRAMQLLQDEVLVEMFEAVEKNLVDSWKAAIDSKQREACWYQVQGLDYVKRALRAWADQKVMQDNKNS